jgi:peroxiredoxin Q/BCP
MRALVTACALFSFSFCVAAGCGPTTRPDGGEGLISVGTPAPDLVGSDASGAAVRLSAVKGRPAIVYFYPKDSTPGCTKQACALRDAFTKFESAGVTIFGVSRDSEASHRAFRAEHKLPFPLVADEAGKVQAAYGVPSKMPGIAARVSFLIDRQGKIAKIWPDVDPALHADQVLAAAKALGG